MALSCTLEWPLGANSSKFLEETHAMQSNVDNSSCQTIESIFGKLCMIIFGICHNLHSSNFFQNMEVLNELFGLFLFEIDFIVSGYSVFEVGRCAIYANHCWQPKCRFCVKNVKITVLQWMHILNSNLH